MKTHIHINEGIKRLFSRSKNRIAILTILCSVTIGLISCGPSRTYWGVDQSYPIGNGHVYYGAYGGDGPHHHHKYDKKRYKKYKKYRKEREKYYKKQYKKYKKYRKHHHHHDD